MVKIALQLSGRLRFTEQSLGSLIAAIIEPLNPDIFCSFWDTENPTTGAKYQDVLQPKLIDFENQTLVRPYLDNLFQYYMHTNMPSMSYKFYQVNRLRNSWENLHGIRYDVVIQARSDNIFFEKLDEDRCNMALEKNAILCANQVYTPEIDDYIPQPRMVDNFYLGPSHSIDIANSTFWKLRDVAQDYTDKGQLHQVRIPEIIQSRIWQENGIKIDSLSGSGQWGNFWYDIDRSPTKFL
jgi:hypothetical protein